MKDQCEHSGFGSSAKKVKGITCDVRECQYHDGENTCMAGHVSVGPTDAKCSSETVCATFRPKTEG